MRFWKYHALGNDYLVVEESEWAPTPAEARRVCDQHFGVGSDGVLVRLADPEPGVFSLRIINPDGSDAEKSGNGLRIFARWLFDRGLVGHSPFRVVTAGGTVTCALRERRLIAVDMGRVRFTSRDVPVSGPDREVLQEEMEVKGLRLRFTAATVGNPHCVIVRDTVSAEEALTLGPLVERDARFPNRTNVQFVQALDRHAIRIEIWERGAGYTLASGSSSCAAAAVALRLGLCDSPVTVHRPGGTLLIEVADDYSVRMTGPVTRVAEGELSPECLEDG